MNKMIIATVEIIKDFKDLIYETAKYLVPIIVIISYPIVIIVMVLYCRIQRIGTKMREG